MDRIAVINAGSSSIKFALFDDDPSKINQLEDGFEKVTPALVQKTAEEYLRPGNRTVYVITPGKTGAQGEKEAR